MSLVNWDWFRKSWDKISEGFMQSRTANTQLLPGLMWDLFYADKLSKDQQQAMYGESDRSGISRAFSRTFATGGQQVEALGKATSPALDVPILGDILRAYDTGITYGLKRPVTTLMLAGDYADTQESPASSFFDPETWRQAWNDSERVSPGQAAVFNAYQIFGGEEREKYDPRTPEGQAQYFDDPMFQGMSGTFDFTLAFVDPFKGVGKLGKAATAHAATSNVPTLAKAGTKVATVTRMRPTQKMLDAGFLERQAFGGLVPVGSRFDDAGTLSPSYERIFNAARTTDLNTFQRLFFNDVAFGGTVATVAWSTARQGDRGVFADSLLAARGSYDAWDRMQTAAPAVASAIGRQRQALNFASAVDQYANQPAARDAVNGAVSTEFSAWVDSFGRDLQEIGTLNENTESFWYGYQGSLERQTKVRDSILDRVRVGLHQYSTSTVPVSIYLGGQTMGRVARSVTRFVNPSSRYDSLIDVNAVSSYRGFRNNVERSVLTPEVKNSLVQQYMLAATPEARSALIAKADQIALNATLGQFGISRALYRELLPELDRLRATGSSLLAGSTRHIPSEFLKAANQATREGRKADAARMNAYATEWQKLVDTGQVPDRLDALPSGERGYLGLAANLGGFKAGVPLMRSTTANLMPMMDYRALELSMRRYMAPTARSRKRLEGLEVSDIEAQGSSHLTDLLKSNLWANKQIASATLKSLQSVWAVTALLRPAQFIRSAADDSMRAMAWHGMLPYFLSGLRGTGRLAYRIGTEGVVWAQQWGIKRVAFLEGRKYDFEAPELDLPALDAPSGLREERPGWYQVAPRVTADAEFHRDDRGRLFAADFDTVEEALAAGVLPLEAYTDYAMQSVREGRAPYSLVAAFENFENGFISEGQLKRQVTEYALDQAGVSSYTNPAWQQDFYDAVLNSPRGIIADPLRGGTAGPLRRPRELYRDYDSGPTFLVKVDSTNGFYRFDDLYDFLSPNAQVMVENGMQVHGVRTDSGDIQLTLVRRRDAPRTVAERMTADQRRRIQEGLKRVGQQDLRLNLGGADVRVKGVFAGMEGDWTRTTVGTGSDSVSSNATTIGLKNAGRAILQAQRTVSVKPSEARYAQSWEYTANRLVANDPVMRLWLEGKSYSDILAWTMTGEGRAWVASRQQKGAGVAEQIQALAIMADKVVPDVGNLRQQVLAHDGKFTDLEAAIPNVKDRPEVLGIDDEIATGKFPVFNAIGRAVDKYFRVFQDMPIDRLVRYPFAETEYRNTITPLVGNYRSYLERTGGSWSQRDIDRLENVARQQTVDVVNQVLYDTMSRTDAAAAMQLMMPFSNAIADSYFKWMRIGWRKPLQVTKMWWRYWGAPDRAGLVYDQDGYHLSIGADGQEIWTDPVTGEAAPAEEDGKPRVHEKHVLFRLPKLGGRQALGEPGKFLPAFNKDSMNPILSVPTAGPIVAVPANRFLLDKPLLADNKLIKTFVLPFGVSDDSVLQQVSPGIVRSFVRWRTENQDLASSTAMQIYQMQLVEYARGERAAKPSIDEAKLHAGNALGLRFLTSFVSPVATQYYSPYKPFTDYYHMLLEKHRGDDNLAMPEFLENAGDEYAYMTAHVSRANVSLPATKGAYKAFREHEAWVQKYPDLAGLVLGDDGAGAFNKAVYEWQKTIRINGKPVREIQSIRDSVEDVDRRATWDEFGKLQALIKVELKNRGLTSLRQRGALDLAAAKQAWIDQHRMSPDGVTVNPWYTDYMSTDGAAMEVRIAAMRDILTDRKMVESRMDLQGLQDYIYERDRMRGVMVGYGYRSLASRRARWLADRWDATVDGLTSNLPFEALHSRWLDRDDLSDPGGLAASSRFEGVSGG